MSEQEKKKTVLIAVLHINNDLHNEQYCFPQIQIWPNTKNMRRMCGYWHCSLKLYGQISPSVMSVRQTHSPDKSSTSKHFSRSECGLKFSQIMCVFLHGHATKTTFEWVFWELTCTCRDTRAWARGRCVWAGLNARCSRKKASQQNYKPEKISVPRHWEQNGFCFLQDNELTRAHHTEQDKQRGCKCYHWWNDAIFLSEHPLYVSAHNS